MPAKYFFIEKKADKSILRLPLNIQNKIDTAFGMIRENPLSGSKLFGELAGYYKYRVGDYRVVYLFDKKKSAVNVVKVEHRRGVYR